MGSLDSIYLWGFLLEVFLLYKLERRMWGTLYTPVILMMLPYTGLLLLAIVSLEFVPNHEFYYPSILVWSLGLLCFEIPSIVLAKFYGSSRKIGEIPKKGLMIPIRYQIGRKYLYFNGFLCLLFILRFLQLRASGLPVGSDEFGEQFATNGLWGHLNLMLIALTISNILLLDRKKKYNRYLLLFVIIGISVSFLNQVKGWVLIPVLGGVVLRLKNHLLQLKFRLVALVCLTGTFFFFMSYYVLLVLTRDTQDTSFFLPFFLQHFIFYLTSGILGFSEACINHTFITGDLVSAVSNFFYPVKAVTEILTGGLPPQSHGVFLDTGFGESNVRTFFGDMYMRGGIIGGIFLSIFNGTVCYSALWLSKVKHALFIDAMYGFISGILLMSWFSSYTHLFNTYEVPIICIILYLVRKYYKRFIPIKHAGRLSR